MPNGLKAYSYVALENQEDEMTEENGPSTESLIKVFEPPDDAMIQDFEPFDKPVSKYERRFYVSSYGLFSLFWLLRWHVLRMPVLIVGIMVFCFCFIRLCFPLRISIIRICVAGGILIAFAILFFPTFFTW